MDGDIAMDRATFDAMTGNAPNTRNVVKLADNHWPTATIPYTFHESLGEYSLLLNLTPFFQFTRI